jgi:hypothetical protein
MSIVKLNITMSLDGYVAGPNPKRRTSTGRGPANTSADAAESQHGLTP